MAENPAFAASGEEAITRRIDVTPNEIPGELSPEELEDYYDIERTVREVEKGDYKRIALQFPDELLRDSVPIFRRLKARLSPGRELYVLADTSYGSCCVDEVAAQHVDADAMVHYGHACMTKTSRLPVIYVFGKKPVDPEDCARKLLKSLEASSTVIENRKAILRHDVAYAHRADKILEKLKAALPSSTTLQYSPIPLTSYPVTSSSTSAQDEVLKVTNGSDQTSDTVAEEGTPSEIILYVGGESLSLTNLLMTHSHCEVHTYDPNTGTVCLASERTNKMLMRRYAVVQKARDADVFGILIGTLGVASYLPLISHLRKVLARAHKKSYTISVGKLNPAKLANFLEIECFVLVACPENSLIDAKDFLRPIVTPYELEIALRAPQSWTGRYVLEFEKLLAEAPDGTQNVSADPEKGDEDLDQPVFSLATGKYRHAKRYGAPETNANLNDPSSALVLRDQDGTVALKDSAAGAFLQARTYRGLETRIGQDAPAVLEQGRSGIARGYADDHPSGG
ncbi:diphthamide biosynthesis protein [Obba rivulosa]|uniref:2-(3-amino-3-carboxypropyl)histidine synthase subunit 2 n=1 Tax=Obba rivulosa TaxID=1052685 RepID=A0A8E2DKK4_9APHY|nr:diphthamide biosynthesis protein [Obba rivulosa]